MKGDTSMNIVDKTVSTMMAFERICVGELFKSDSGDIFMRISRKPLIDVSSGTANCFCLTTDDLCFFADEEWVEKVEAELTVYREY